MFILLRSTTLQTFPEKAAQLLHALLPLVTDRNEKLPQWKFQSPKPACPPQQRRATCCANTYVLVPEVCAEGARGCALYDGGSEGCTMCAMSAGVHALYVALYSVNRGGRAPFA